MNRLGIAESFAKEFVGHTGLLAHEIGHLTMAKPVQTPTSVATWRNPGSRGGAGVRLQAAARRRDPLFRPVLPRNAAGRMGSQSSRWRMAIRDWPCDDRPREK